MQKTCFYILLIFSVNNFIYSQKKILAGPEIGFNSENYMFDNVNDVISEKPEFTGSLGINCEIRFENNFALGVGFISKPYRQKIKLNKTSLGFSKKGFHSLLMPISIIYNLPIRNHRFSLKYFAGGTGGYNLYYLKSEPNRWNRRYTGADSNSVVRFQSINSDANLKRFFFLIHFGGGIEFDILKKYKLTVLIRQSIGFVDLIRINAFEDLSMVIFSSRASKFTRGDHTSFAVQLAYPLN